MWEVNLSVCLRAGRLAKGTKEWPLEVGLQGNTARQSFYLRLREDSVDAEASLTNLADESAGDYFAGCCLESAGLICSHCSQGETAPSAGALFPADPELPGELSGLLREKRGYMEKGICLWMVSELKKLSVFSGALKIGYHGAQRLVILGCLEKRGSIWDQLYYAGLPEIELFYAVVFRNVRLLYQIAEKKSRLALSGEVELSVENFSLGFQGEIRMDERGYRAEMSALENGDTPVFALGSAGSLQLDQLIFHLECAYASEGHREEKRCYLEAEACLAGQKWKGGLSYASGEKQTCWQMELTLETDLSLDSLLAQIFEIGQSGEPLFDLEILKGSSLSCTMADGSSENGESAEKTYSLRLHTVLTLVVSLELWGEVELSSDTFRFSLQAGSVLDLEILQIAGRQGEKGPAFSYQYKKGDRAQGKSMEIEGELTFFVERLLGGSFWYSGGKEDWSVRAELWPEGVLRTVFGEHLTVIYDKKTGFRLEDIDSLSYAGEAFDFLKRMREYLEILGKANSCEKLQETVDQIVQSVFDKNNFQELEAVLAVLARDELEAYVSGLLCRKLVSQEEAARLLPDDPSGGGGESGGDSGTAGGSGGEGGGGESGGGVSETGFSIFAAGGGTAFSFSETGDWMAAGFAGMAAVFMVLSGGGKNDPAQPLPCPKFRGKLDGAKLRIEIWQVEGASGYELDIMWNGPSRADRFLSWKAEEEPPRISFLEILVKGKAYLAVRALHEKKERSSPWSEGNYLGEVTHQELISWSVQSGLCVRDCLQLLREHKIELEESGAMKMVLEKYLHPADKEEVAREHYINQDSARVCLEHLDTAFPHLSSGELLICMWRKGYGEEETVQALRERRPQITMEDTEGLLLKAIQKEEKSMDLKMQITQFAEQKKKGQLTELEWRRALSELLVVYDPVDVAAILKEAGRTAAELALDLKEILADHRAVTVGGIILNERIYPGTTREEMAVILSKAFPEENVEKVLGILYPTTVEVSARVIWNDTGVQIEEDEVVTAQYVSGLWNVNPPCHKANYGPEGIGIIAKPGYACPGESEGCLVGRIGNGESFRIGRKAVLPKGRGPLFLTANDDLYGLYGSGYSDNRGEVMVEIGKEMR
ncbi:hypothetical protein [Lachnoclostridium sp. An118]|uniref:hypothetical protein n=1 Tax=Lachnoclostridium sp. An118 TaxID=1965547 RepID=UPI000B39B375|nr:hypothetical protein [Lachnoclostridium sp. An118]OUQ47264.1 hypothetical protein B5E62_15645 [Lachnoclostridium sp. An118]